MSYDERWDYDEPEEPAGPTSPGRGMYWLAGTVLAVVSLLIGYLIAGDRDPDTTPAAQVGATSAEATSAGAGSPEPDPTEPADSPSAAPSAAASPSPSAVASASPSPSPTAAGPAALPAGVLAAVSNAGDVQLVDPDTGAVERTLVAHNDPQVADPVDNTSPAVSWHAASGVAYFTRGNCSIYRHNAQTGITEPVTAGRSPVVSPDGSRLALWTCTPGPGELFVLETSTGKVTVSLPITGTSPEQGGNMTEILDIDWRPDGNALVVTEGWEGSDAQFVVDLRKLPKTVVDGARLPIRGVEGSYHLVEYVGTRLVMSGTCCHPDEQSGHVAVRDGKTGVLTLVPQLSDIGLIEPVADRAGRIRYLRRESSDQAGAMWGLDKLGGEPREIGGEFRALDW